MHEEITKICGHVFLFNITPAAKIYFYSCYCTS
jgi:hypothetical protein